jgi:chemotaxis protein MotA
MDILTVIGLLGTAALMIWAVVAGASYNFGVLVGYWDTPSAAIVIGGGIMAVMVSLPLGPILMALKASLKTIFNKPPDAKKIVGQLMEFAVIARRDGILALESKLGGDVHPFVATGIRMAVDGFDGALIEKLIGGEIESMADRHGKAKKGIELLGKYAPAMGMIGTLLGLVAMLQNLSDPSSIGPSMAVALLTTLYGALLANCVCLPLVDKLTYYSRLELTVFNLVLQGVLSIQSGDNPRIVEQKLSVYLPKNQRNTGDKK